MGVKDAVIKNCLQLLKVRDFKIKHDVQAYVFKKLDKETGNRYEIIFGYEKYWDTFGFQIPITNIYFHEIEGVLEPLFRKYKLFELETDDTISDTLINYPYMDNKKFGIENEISCIEAFEPLRQEMQKILDNLSLPFIDKYSNLENVAEKISELKFENVCSFVNPLGSGLIRAAFILKMTGHPSFKRRLDEFYDYLGKYYITIKNEEGENHWETQREIKKILAMNEFFCEDLEECGYKIDHIWEREGSNQITE